MSVGLDAAVTSATLSDAECRAIEQGVMAAHEANDTGFFTHALIRAGHAARGDEAREAERLRGYLRQHAISHDPTKRPMRSRCNICEAEWGGDDAEHHGSGCPFVVIAAMTKREG